MEKREGMCANKFILLRLYANIELQKNGYFMFRLDGIYVIDTILNKTYSVILCKNRYCRTLVQKIRKHTREADIGAEKWKIKKARLCDKLK